MRFYDPWGAEILRVRRPPPGDPDDLCRAHPPIGPRTCAGGEGEPMELDLVVDAFLDATTHTRLLKCAGQESDTPSLGWGWSDARANANNVS